MISEFFAKVAFVIAFIMPQISPISLAVQSSLMQSLLMSKENYFRLILRKASPCRFGNNISKIIANALIFLYSPVSSASASSPRYIDDLF